MDQKLERYDLPLRDPLWLTAVGMLAVFAGVLCLRLVYDSTLFSRMIEKSAIAELAGRITQAEGGVRVRSGQQMLWYDVQVEGHSYGVSEGDAVFTGPAGTAQVELVDGSSLSIRPGSMVVIQLKREREGGAAWFSRIVRPLLGMRPQSVPSLALKQGTAELQLSGRRTVEVGSEARAFRISSGDASKTIVQLEQDTAHPGGAVITSESPVQVLEQSPTGAAGASYSVSKGSTLSLPGVPGPAPALAQTMYRAVAPAEGQIFHSPTLDSGRMAIVFSWEWVTEPHLGDLAWLEIDGQERLQIPLSKAERKKRLELAFGAYKWRIAYSRDGVQPDAPWRHFVIASLGPPKILGPANDFIAQTKTDGKAPVRLTWDTVSEDVEVIVTRKGSKDAEHLRGSAEGIDLSVPLGEYLWKARRIDKTRKKSAWSYDRRFLVSADTPRVDEAVSSVLKPTPVQVKPDPKPVVPKVAPKVAVRPEPVVRPSREASAPAKPVATSKPEAISPDTKSKASPQARIENVRATSFLAGGAGGGGSTLSASISWKPVDGSRTYKIRLLKEDGTEIAHFQSQQAKVDIKGVKILSMPVFYEIEAVLASGGKVSFEKTALSARAKGPQLKEPAPQSTFRLGDRILMTWEIMPLVERYRIQLSTDPSFKTLELDEEVTRNLRFFSGGSAGVLYWRVQGVGRGIEGEWSSSSSFIRN